jgi:hypothetical protein
MGARRRQASERDHDAVLGLSDASATVLPVPAPEPFAEFFARSTARSSAWPRCSRATGVAPRTSPKKRSWLRTAVAFEWSPDRQVRGVPRTRRQREEPSPDDEGWIE